MDRLAPADLDRFLRGLARRVPCPVRLVLTGGGEAMVLGGTRPTGDLDFALVVADRFAAHWPAIEDAVGAARDEAGIAVQYATDIDRWSSVSMPAARRRTRAFRRLGRLSVHLLEPTCWAVYARTGPRCGERRSIPSAPSGSSAGRPGFRRPDPPRAAPAGLATASRAG